MAYGGGPPRDSSGELGRLDAWPFDLEEVRVLRKLDHGIGTASAASAIVSGTWLLWLLRGPLGEGRELVEAALRDDVPMVAQMRSRLLYGAAAFSLAHGDLDPATAAGRECLAVSRNGTPPPHPERDRHQRRLVAVRARLDEQDFAAAWINGQAMTLDSAVNEAKAVGAPTTM